MTALEQIRAFEVEQPHVTAQIIGEYALVLRITEALLLNASGAALERSTIGDDETPVFFLLHTIVDDLRQAELNLLLGYTIYVATALRDAIEAMALAALLWKIPARAREYWNGAEYGPSDVRQQLEGVGLRPLALAWIWFTYEFLSDFRHPNVSRMAHVMDERKAGATRPMSMTAPLVGETLRADPLSSNSLNSSTTNCSRGIARHSSQHSARLHAAPCAAARCEGVHVRQIGAVKVHDDRSGESVEPGGTPVTEVMVQVAGPRGWTSAGSTSWTTAVLEFGLRDGAGSGVPVAV